MYSDTLKIGMKINIEIINDLNEEKKTIYPSQILDILESNELIIRGPVKNKKIFFLHKEDEVYISYNILNKGKHLFKGLVLSRKHTNMYTLKIKIISQIKNVQNRAYYRLPKTIPVIKSFYKERPYEDLHREECETKDISGGGIRLYTNYDHSIGDNVTCSFIILGQTISIKCKVVRIEEVDSFNYKYSLGLSFLDIDENHRDTIIRYIFNQQRKLRAKGLI